MAGSIFRGMTQAEFKEFMGALVVELQPLVTSYYSDFVKDRAVDAVAKELLHSNEFRGRVVTALLLMAAAQVQADKDAPPVTWACRCGTVNGVNLEKCRVCGKREGESGEVASGT